MWENKNTTYSTMVTTALKHPPQSYLVVFQAMEKLLEEDSFDFEDLIEEYNERIYAVEVEKTRLEGLLRDLKDQDESDLMLQEIDAVEALFEKAKGRLQDMKRKSQRLAMAHKVSTTGLWQVHATIQDLLREIAEMPKNRKRKA